MALNRWTPGALEELAKETGLVVDTGESARNEASQDFGHLVDGHAAGVVRPFRAEEVQQIVRFANKRSLPVTIRGGGMSQSGQSIPHDGLSLDMRNLALVGEPDLSRRSISSEPGATWRKLLEKLEPSALAPAVVPLNLDLTVGGTLSAGGFGSTSHMLGPAVSNTLAVDVVTGRGDLVRCGPTSERPTFDAVLGGVGRYGAITRVELALRTALPCVRTFYLLYDDLQTMLDDQRSLAESRRADHLEGFCAATVQGLKKGPSGRRTPFALWSYGLHVSVEHDAGHAPEPEEALAGLRPTKLVHVEDDRSSVFASRYDVRFEAMRATGAWDQAHPWIECVLPVSAAREVIPRVLEIVPLFLGDGHRLSWIADTDRPTSLSFPERGPFLSFAILPMGLAPALRDPALRALKAVHDLLLSAGGKRYLSGWLFRTDDTDASAGHNALVAPLARAKAALDENNVFNSCLHPH